CDKIIENMMSFETNLLGKMYVNLKNLYLIAKIDFETLLKESNNDDQQKLIALLNYFNVKVNTTHLITSQAMILQPFLAHAYFNHHKISANVLEYLLHSQDLLNTLMTIWFKFKFDKSIDFTNLCSDSLIHILKLSQFIIKLNDEIEPSILKSILKTSNENLRRMSAIAQIWEAKKLLDLQSMVFILNYHDKFSDTIV